MKKSRVKLISSMLVAFCIVVIGVVGVIGVRAAEEVTLPDVMYEAGVEYKTDNEAPTTVPTGYLFAGWYDNTGTEDAPIYSPVKEPTLGNTYVAKYVPKQMLGIKAQVTKNIIRNEELDNLKKNAIRFVTSLDSTNYKDIGFDISINGVAQDTESYKTNKVYRIIYAIGATNTDKPFEYNASQVFENAASQFFKTYTFTSVPEAGFDTDIEVRPYYVTYDGTKVYGTQAIKTVNYCRAWVYVDSESTATKIGTHNNPFQTIEAAVAVMDEEITKKIGLSPKVILKNDITLEKQVCIDKTLTLTSQGDRKTISRTESMTSGDAMVYVKNTEETIVVTVDNVRFDGTYTDTATNIRALAVGTSSSDETLNINNTLIENFVSTKTGSSLMVRGTVNFTDSTIQNGSSTNSGGLVYVNSGVFTMNSGTICNGESTSKGGCVYVDSSSESKINIKGGTIENGRAPQGGNIYLDQSSCNIDSATIQNGTADSNAGNIYANASTLTLSNQATISGGTATDNGGSIYLASTTFTMTDSTIKDGVSNNNGGNVYALGTSSAKCKMEITGGQIMNGQASYVEGDNSHGTGGNLYMEYTTLDVTGATISGGQAVYSRGGNLYIRQGSTLNLNADSVIEDGYAYVNGGNIMSNKSSTINVTGGTVQSGTAETGQGGNVFLSTTSTMNVSDGSFLGGTSKGEGANIVLTQSTSAFELEGGKVQITGGMTSNGIASNLYLPYTGISEQTGITITGTLEDGTAIGIKPFAGACDFATGTGVTGACVDYFIPDAEGMQVTYSDCTLTLAFTDNNKADNYIDGTTTFVPMWASERTVAAGMLDFDEKYEQFFNPNGRLMSVAHRGDSKHYPENSAEAFLSSIMAGADIVEVDVRKTTDSIFFVMHDETLKRTTNVGILNAQGADIPTTAEECSYEQLCQLRLRQGVGGTNAPVTNCVIPTLKEVIQLCYGRVFITLDNKCGFEWAEIQAVIEELVEEGYDRSELYRTVMLPYTKTNVSSADINAHTVDNYETQYEKVQTMMNEIQTTAGVCSALMSKAFLNNDYAKYVETDSEYESLYEITRSNLRTTLSLTASAIKKYNFPYVLRCNEYDQRFTDIYQSIEVDGEIMNLFENYRVHIECLQRNDYREMWKQIDDEGYGIIVTNDIYGLTKYIQETEFKSVEVAPSPLPKPDDDSQKWPS